MVIGKKGKALPMLKQKCELKARKKRVSSEMTHGDYMSSLDKVLEEMDI